MSLNAEQRAVTRDELHANLVLSGLTTDELAARLEISPRRVTTALEVQGAPQTVWLVRDYLENVVGERAVPYTVLVESARAAAESWFPLRRAPSC